MTATAKAPMAIDPIAQRDFSLMVSNEVPIGMTGNDTR